MCYFGIYIVLFLVTVLFSEIIVLEVCVILRGERVILITPVNVTFHNNMLLVFYFFFCSGYG